MPPSGDQRKDRDQEPGGLGGHSLSNEARKELNQENKNQKCEDISKPDQIQQPRASKAGPEGAPTYPRFPNLSRSLSPDDSKQGTERNQVEVDSLSGANEDKYIIKS